MRYLSLGLYILLNYFVSAKEINIANCNELWTMSNSMNNQPLYAMKIYSCIEYPTLDIVTEHQPTILNLSNQTIFNNSKHNSSLRHPMSPSPTSLAPISPSPMPPSPMDILPMTPSPMTQLPIVPSPSMASHTSPSSDSLSPSPNKQQTTPSPDQETIVPTNFEQELTNLKLNLTSSPSSSEIPLSNESEISDTIGLTIVIIIVSIILTMVVIFVIFKYKKNKIGDKNINKDNLKNHATNTKPHVFSASQSSKTEDTLVSSPRSHPTHSHQPAPPKKPPQKRKNKLPKLPTNSPVLDNTNVSQNTISRLRPSRMPNSISNNTSNNTSNRVKKISDVRDLESGIKTSS